MSGYYYDDSGAEYSYRREVVGNERVVCFYRKAACKEGVCPLPEIIGQLPEKAAAAFALDFEGERHSEEL